MEEAMEKSPDLVTPEDRLELERRQRAYLVAWHYTIDKKQAITLYFKHD
jgi:hypothetical protein